MSEHAAVRVAMMSSSFSGLTNALAALNVQRYGMEVTGQNIANANTPGYTRQRAELAAVGPAAGVAALYATQHPNGSVTVTAPPGSTIR